MSGLPMYYTPNTIYIHISRRIIAWYYFVKIITLHIMFSQRSQPIPSPYGNKRDGSSVYMMLCCFL